MTDVLASPAAATRLDDSAPPATWRVAAALARIEGRRLLPAALLSLGFAVMFGTQDWDEVLDLRQVSAGIVFPFFLLVAITLIATTLATLRSRRHGTEELFSATPSAPEARTAAHVLSSLAPAVLGTVVMAGIVVFTLIRNTSYARLDVAELAVVPLLVLGAGALGVLLARWTRTSLAGPAACLAIAFVQAPLASTSLLDSGWRRLSFWVYPGDLPWELLPPRLTRWHLVYLAGLVAMAAVGALVVHGLRRPVVVAGIAAIAVVAVSAAFQAQRPSAAGWVARNDLLARPQAHQVCEDRAGVRYCAYPAHRALIAHWEPVVAGVRRAVPPQAWPATLEVSQRVQPNDRRWVPDETTAPLLPDLVAQDGAVPDDGNIHPPILWEESGLGSLLLATQVAARTVGLPLSPSPSRQVCDAAGQGRAVLTLWLAAQATPAAGDALRRATATEVLEVGARPYVVLPDAGVPTGVAWGLHEALLAVELLDRPPANLAADMAAGWTALTSPAVTTSEVAARLGLEPVSPARGAADEPQHGPVAPVLGPPCP